MPTTRPRPSPPVLVLVAVFVLLASGAISLLPIVQPICARR